MSNYEDCVEQLIEERVQGILKRLPALNPEERYACIIENIEDISSDRVNFGSAIFPWISFDGITVS